MTTTSSPTAHRTAAPAPRPLGHQPALDGLRALAALVVLMFHAKVPGFANGAIGVDIFFTLSGFLITGLLLGSLARAGRVDFLAFYTRRALRLLPAYLAVVVCAVLADFVIDSGGTLRGAVVSFFYVANWAVGGLGMGLGALGHTWSLSIEEQFYLVWPALLVAVHGACRGRPGRLRAALAALVASSYALTIVLLAAGVSTQLVYNATPTRAVELLAGALLAVHVAYRPERHEARGRTELLGWLALGLLLVLAACDGIGPVTDILAVWPTVATLTCTVIAVSCGARGLLARALSWRPLVEVGLRSYGLYLWHFPIFTSIDATLGLQSWPPRLLGLALTAVVVPLSYRWIEQPFLRRKSRVGTSRRARRPVSAASPGRPERAGASG